MTNRRELLINVSCMALSLPFVGRASLAQTPSILRRDINEFEKDAGALQALRDAIDVLRKKDDYGQRPAIDGWTALATNHSLWCFGGVAAYETHFGWWFFPWHRAFLIQLEHALQDAIKEPALRLPYWNWVTTSSLPKSLAEPKYMKGGQSVQNPLFDDTRFGPVGQGGKIDYTDLGAPSMTEKELIAVDTFASFGGGQPTQKSSKRPGTLESTPHNYIHRAIGYDQPNDRVGNMAVGMSPLDPIFLLHHANIDRLWTVWLNAGGRRENPSDPTWREHHFAFPNTKDFSFVDYQVAELLDSEKSPGNYRYDRERLVEQIVSASSKTPLVSRFSLPLRVGSEREIAGPGLAIEVPDRLQTMLGGVKPETAGAATVVLEGIPLPQRPSTIRVCARPEGSQQQTLIGSFSTLPTTTRGSAKTDIVLPINETTRRFLIDNKNISIKAEASGAQLGSIKVDSFSIEVPQ